MNADGIHSANGLPGGPPDLSKKPRNIEDAARQFEHVLIKQMVEAMTKDLFDNSLVGDDAPQWMGAYGDMQSDVLATELANQLSESGRLGISEMLMQQWQRRSEEDEIKNEMEDPS